MAAMLLGNLGSSMLGPLGGWIGSAIGSMIDNAIFGNNEDQKGPRLTDLNTVRADPGVPIPLLFGADRLPGIIIASTALIETVNKEKIGGKGGPSMITYTYHASIDYMICEGPILGIARMWAEGNMIRGTAYELETSTSENPEKIGGIPYPDYYKDHLYDPNLIPWTLDRAFTPTDDGKVYIKSENNLSMLEVSYQRAEEILAGEIDVLYWRDTATGYYIPLHNDHAYGASRAITGRPSSYNSFAGGYLVPSGQGNSNALKNYWTVIDLTNFMTAEDLEGIESGGGTFHVSDPDPTVENEYSFGVFVGDWVVSVSWSFYSDGYSTTVDGNNVGVATGGGGASWSRGVGGVTRTGAASGDIPEGTRYIYVAATYALAFPVFAGYFSGSGGGFNVNYTHIYAEDENLQRDWPHYWNLYDAINDYSSIAVLQFKGVDNLTFYHGTFDQHQDAHMRDALLIDLEDDEDADIFAVPAYLGRSHVVLDTLQLADFGNRIPSLSFEAVQYDDVRIAAVVREMMRRAEVDENYYDTAELPDVGVASHVLGYSVATKTTYRAALETILEAFRIDAAEIGNEIVFRPRDRTDEWVIDWQDLAAMEPNGNVDNLIELVYRDKIEMPKSFTVRFKDVERAYQVNTAHYYRQQGPGIQDSISELASVLPPAIAKAYARDKMRDLWLERVTIKMQVPHKYVYVYPTDIVRLNGSAYGKHDIVFKVTNANRGANGIIELEGVLREDTVYVPRPGEVTNTNMDNSTWNHRPRAITPDVYYTDMDFLDVAPLAQGFNTGLDPNSIAASFYGAMSGGTGWKGAVLYVSQDSGASYTELLTSTDRACVGYATSPLPYHRAEYFDTTNYVDVNLTTVGDVLENITVDQLYAGFNYCKIGNEILQFMTAEKLVGFPNRWRLSGLNRGRRGTDIYETLNGHYAGDRFIMLEKDKVFYAYQRDNWLNQPQFFKIVPFGANLADVEPIIFTNTGNIYKPLAPVFLRGVRDDNNALSVQFIRQDKTGYEWVEGADANLSEYSWDHVMEIFDPTGVTVKRRWNLTFGYGPYNRERLIIDGIDYGRVMTDFNHTVATMVPGIFNGDFVYTADMQTADGYTPGDPVWVSVHKQSKVSGYATKARV